jgi:hypothetical protein
MLFTQAAKLKPWFCSGDYRPFFGHTKTPILHVVLSENIDAAAATFEVLL